MSKWGFVTETNATQKFKDDPKETAKMVSDMSQRILDQDKEIKELQGSVSDHRLEIMTKNAIVGDLQRTIGRLEGYQERVRELDQAAETHTGPMEFRVVPTPL